MSEAATACGWPHGPTVSELLAGVPKDPETLERALRAFFLGYTPAVELSFNTPTKSRDIPVHIPALVMFQVYDYLCEDLGAVDSVLYRLHSGLLRVSGIDLPPPLQHTIGMLFRADPDFSTLPTPMRRYALDVRGSVYGSTHEDRPRLLEECRAVVAMEDRLLAAAESHMTRLLRLREAGG